jgi:hypothetical protein
VSNPHNEHISDDVASLACLSWDHRPASCSQEPRVQEQAIPYPQVAATSHILIPIRLALILLQPVSRYLNDRASASATSSVVSGGWTKDGWAR